MGSADFVVQPSPSVVPIAIRRSPGDLKHRRRFFQGQASEIAQVNQFCHGRVVR